MPNSDRVIRSRFSIFSCNCLLEEIVSDNGTQFTSNEFKELCNHRGINHRLTAPYHPASNGESERFVCILKDGMRTFGQIKEWEYAVLNFLFTYRTTPNTTTGKTPAELLMVRNLRTKWDLLRNSHRSHGENAQLRQIGSKFKPSRCFIVGYPVWICDFRPKQNKWIEGSISEVLGTRNNKISTVLGILKRHLNLIRKRLLDINIQQPDEQLDTTTTQSTTESSEEYESPDEANFYNTDDITSCDSDDSIDTTDTSSKQIQPLRQSSRIRKPPDRYRPTS